MDNLKKYYMILVLLFLSICLSSLVQSKECDFVGIQEKMSYLQEKIGQYPPGLTHSELKVVKKKYESTINDLNNCLKESPDNAEVEWRLGECYRLGHNLDLKDAWDNSEKHLKTALSLDPKNINAHIALGRLYVNSDTSLCLKAEELFKKALELSGDKPLPAAHDGLFFSYYYQGKFEQAVKEADTILALYPDNQMYKGLREFALCRANGQDCPVPLFPVDYCGVYGYIDRQGKIIINLQYNRAGRFHEGLAIVKVNENNISKDVYIDGLGKIVINPSFYGEVYDFSEGLALVNIYGKWGFIDKKGSIAINPQFKEAGPFAQGLAQVTVGEKCGYIDKKGRVLIAPQFYGCKTFSEGTAAVKIEKKWGYIDTTGKVVIEPQFDHAWNFLEGIAPVKIGGKYGYIDSSGKVTIAPQFDGAANFREGLAMVEVGGKWGYIDKAGKMVIAAKFKNAFSFSEGLAAVSAGSTWGYIDKTGRTVIKAKFDWAYSFKGGLAEVGIGLGFGYIDKTGKYIWEPKNCLSEALRNWFPPMR